MHPAARTLHERIARGDTPGLQYLYFSADSILFRHQEGLAVVADGLPVARATTFNGFSVTKTVTAVAILQLVEDGLLELEAPAHGLLPSFRYPRDITVRHLLTHTAGLANPIPLSWTHATDDHATFDRDAFFRRQYARHPKVRRPPNARFAYSNLGFELLGEIIESVTGQSYERYVTEHILDRIGIPPHELGFAIDPRTHARGYHKRWSLSYPLFRLLVDAPRVFAGREGEWQAFRPYHMNGAAYGGLVGTADGFARFVQALLDPSHGVLTAPSRRLLLEENRLNDGTASGMSLAWFTGTLEEHRFFDHAGGGGGYYAELRLYPALGRGSVLLLNRTGLSNRHLLDEVDLLLIRAEEAAGRGATGGTR